MAICATNDHEAERLYGEMDEADLLADERFATVQGRVENYREVEATIERWTRGLPTREVVQRLSVAGVAVAAVRRRGKLSETSRCSRGAKRCGSHTHCTASSTRLYGPGLPIRFSGSEQVLGTPPMLGEHNESVYRDVAGYSAERVADLGARGVV